MVFPETKIVCRSTCAAEYVALASACKEILWQRNFMKDICLKLSTKPTVLYVDNLGAIATANRTGWSKNMKHIDIRYYFVRELIENGEIEINYINT